MAFSQAARRQAGAPRRASPSRESESDGDNAVDYSELDFRRGVPVRECVEVQGRLEAAGRAGDRAELQACLDICVRKGYHGEAARAAALLEDLADNADKGLPAAAPPPVAVATPQHHGVARPKPRRAERHQRGSADPFAAPEGCVLPECKYAVVNEVHVRAGPSVDTPTLASKSQGEVFSVVEETFDGWLRLHGEPGWAPMVPLALDHQDSNMMLLLQLGEPPPLAVPRLFGHGKARVLEVVHRPRVLVRTAPHMDAKVSGYYTAGKQVRCLSQTYNGWVRLAAGGGWMLTSHPELGALLEPCPMAVGEDPASLGAEDDQLDSADVGEDQSEEEFDALKYDEPLLQRLRGGTGR